MELLDTNIVRPQKASLASITSACSADEVVNGNKGRAGNKRIT
jgi:hypothetical protein